MLDCLPMSETRDALKRAFDTAFGEYLDAMHARKMALEAAMRSASTEVHQAYAAASEEEQRKRVVYLDAARAMHEAAVRAIALSKRTLTTATT